MKNPMKRLRKALKKAINVDLFFLEGLTLLFIALKLCSVIHWSWWFILIPIYIPIGIACISIIFTLILCSFLMIWTIVEFNR